MFSHELSTLGLSKWIGTVRIRYMGKLYDIRVLSGMMIEGLVIQSFEKFFCFLFIFHFSSLLVLTRPNSYIIIFCS